MKNEKVKCDEYFNVYSCVCVCVGMAPVKIHIFFVVVYLLRLYLNPVET